VRSSEVFTALREPQFRLLFVGQTVSVVGDAVVPVALAFAVLGLTGSASDLGFVLAAHTITLVAFVLLGGVWADRLPRQRLMLGSDLIRGAAQAAVAALLLTHHARLWHLVVLTVVYSAAEAFFRPAMTGLVPGTVSVARLQQANALIAMSYSASRFVGPALAGIFIAVGGVGTAFAVDAASFGVNAIFLARLRPAAAPRSERQHLLADLAAGWNELRSRTWLWAIIVWASTYLLVFAAPVFVLGPLVAKESLGGASAWATIMVAFGFGSVVGGAVALRWRPGRPLLACSASVLLVAPTSALLALREPVWAIGAAQLLAGISMGFFLAVWETTLQQHVPPDKLSRVSSYDWMGSFAMMPIGYVLVGPVSAAIGVSETLWLATAWVVISTAAVLGIRDVRELRRVEEAPVEVRLPEPVPVP
jgi:MFS family permease